MTPLQEDNYNNSAPGGTIDSREQGLATQSRPLVLLYYYTLFTGYAFGLEFTPC